MSPRHPGSEEGPVRVGDTVGHLRKEEVGSAENGQTQRLPDRPHLEFGGTEGLSRGSDGVVFGFALTRGGSFAQPQELAEQFPTVSEAGL